jgi:hypothetical protein
MNAPTRACLAALLAAGLGTAIAAVPAVASPAPPPPITGSGTVSCAVVGRLVFSPPLANGGTATSDTATLIANTNGCSGTGDGATIARGHVAGSVTLPSNDCTNLTSGSLPNLVANVAWHVKLHSPKLAASQVTFIGMTVSVLPSGKAQATLSGSDTGGSFNGDAAAASVTISQSLKAIGNACANGTLAHVNFAAANSTASLQ